MLTNSGMASNRRLGQGVKLEAIDHEISKQKIDNLMTQVGVDNPAVI